MPRRQGDYTRFSCFSLWGWHLDPENVGPWQNISTLGCGHGEHREFQDLMWHLSCSKPGLCCDTRMPPGSQARDYSSLLFSLILSQKKEEGSGVPRQKTGSS